METQEPPEPYAPNPAKLRDRLAAMGLDYALLMGVSLPGVLIPLIYWVRGMNSHGDQALGYVFMALCTFLFLLIPCMIGILCFLIKSFDSVEKNGQTIGQKICAIRVADRDSLFIPSYSRLLLRYIDFLIVISVFIVAVTACFWFFNPFIFLLLLIVLIPFQLIDFLLLLLPGHRSLRDRLSKTCVVYVSLNRE